MVSEDSLAKKNGAKPRKHRERHATLSTIGDWQPAADRAPLELLAEQDRGRVQELLPLRRERMSVSPFTFYRGSAILMASDLASLPVSGIEVQICGDAHIANFGVYASPERNLVFDLNDFDETAPGPWEWDVLRMATSVRLAALDRGFRTVADEMVRHSAAAYRQEMDAYAEMSPVDIWYDHLDVREIINGTPKKRREVLERQLARGKKRTGRQLAPKITAGDPPRFVDQPPTFHRMGLEDEDAPDALAMLEAYRTSLPDNVRALFDRYAIVDTAFKVVGVGSVGTRCYVSLHLADCGDPRLLQIKEATESVVTRFAGTKRYGHEGERVVLGQRLMQATGDIFLGWTQTADQNYYVRQLRDMKISADLSSMPQISLWRYAGYCAKTLARAHARAGNPVAIAAYLAGSADFDKAVTRFARAYARVSKADYDAFCKESPASSNGAVKPAPLMVQT
jgi:uncharacterized protein (DUF2252 family)